METRRKEKMKKLLYIFLLLPNFSLIGSEKETEEINVDKLIADMESYKAQVIAATHAIEAKLTDFNTKKAQMDKDIASIDDQIKAQQKEIESELANQKEQEQRLYNLVDNENTENLLIRSKWRYDVLIELNAGATPQTLLTKYTYAKMKAKYKDRMPAKFEADNKASIEKLQSAIRQIK